MKRKLTAYLLAGALALAPVCGSYAPAMSAYAYTLEATPKSVSVPKTVIAVGETMRIKIEWTNGALPENIEYSSHDDDIAAVSADGVITGVDTGITEIYVDIPSLGKSYTLTVSVSDEVTANHEYPLCDLQPGSKLLAGDILVDSDESEVKTVDLLNDKGEFTVISLSTGDYTMQSDAMVVGLDGIILYIVPLGEGYRYTDITLLSEGDVIDRDTFLITHGYSVNGRVHPVFLKSYYDKYIGEGEIRVKSIDHERMKAELEAVSTEKPVLRGDANGDGVFGIADVITFSKWLLGDTTAEIPDWKALDLNSDGVLDTFDLIPMREELCTAIKETAEPMLMILDYSITEDPEKGWGSEFAVRVIDSMGAVHSKSFDTAYTANESLPDVWWEAYGEEIMAAGETEPLIVDPAHLAEVNALAARGNELKEASQELMDMSIEDYGLKTLSVFEHTDNGLVPVPIAMIGDESWWADDRNAQEVITMMMENDYYSDSFIIRFYKKNHSVPEE